MKFSLEGRDEKEFRRHVAVQAGIEIGLERFLEREQLSGNRYILETLADLKQLPGLAMQRLMEKRLVSERKESWKTAAMVRLMKIMTRLHEGCKRNFLYGRLYI